MFKVNQRVLMCSRNGTLNGVISSIDSRSGDIVIRWNFNGRSGDNIMCITPYDISRLNVREDDKKTVCERCRYRLQALMGCCPSWCFIEMK